MVVGAGEEERHRVEGYFGSEWGLADIEVHVKRP
jgi:hypothetical protein